MTLNEILQREKCTPEEARKVIAFYLALQMEPMLEIWYGLYRMAIK